MALKKIKNAFLVGLAFSLLLMNFGCSLFSLFGPDNIDDIDGDSKTTPYSGMPYQGGIVFTIFEEGTPGYVSGETHGLIAAIADQSDGIQWCDSAFGPETGATGTEVGTGQSNTTKIVDAQGPGAYAAQLCDDYINPDSGTGVYDDWYLPSQNELDLLNWNKDNVTGIYCSWYWSSTENSPPGGTNYARCQLMITGTMDWYPKDGSGSYLRVRAIRSF